MFNLIPITGITDENTLDLFIDSEGHISGYILEENGLATYYPTIPLYQSPSLSTLEDFGIKKIYCDVPYKRFRVDITLQRSQHVFGIRLDTKGYINLERAPVNKVEIITDSLPHLYTFLIELHLCNSILERYEYLKGRFPLPTIG